mgnify:FL=1
MYLLWSWLSSMTVIPKWKRAGPNGEQEIKFPTGRRFMVEKQLDHNERHRGEWKVMEWDKRTRDFEWQETYSPKAYAKEQAMKLGQWNNQGKKVADYSNMFRYESVDYKLNEDKVTKLQLNALEKVLDKVFARIGMDVEFTKHFLDRVNDIRNKQQITVKELAVLFKKEYIKWGKPIAKMGDDAEGVMSDLASDVNIPFVLNWNPKKKELEMYAKTIMRKKNFSTPDKKFKVESVQPHPEVVKAYKKTLGAEDKAGDCKYRGNKARLTRSTNHLSKKIKQHHPDLDMKGNITLRTKLQSMKHEEAPGTATTSVAGAGSNPQGIVVVDRRRGPHRQPKLLKRFRKYIDD